MAFFSKPQQCPQCNLVLPRYPVRTIVLEYGRFHCHCGWCSPELELCSTTCNEPPNHNGRHHFDRQQSKETDMPKDNENTMQRIIEAALFTPLRNGRWGLPIVFWGPPGVGKTEQIRAVCRRYGLYCEHLAPGERGEGAFGVTPVPEGLNGHMVLRYPPPEWVMSMRQVDNTEAGVVFLDEINTAAPALQPALLGCIQERRVGGDR